jgi:hypothetical protein
LNKKFSKVKLSEPIENGKNLIELKNSLGNVKTSIKSFSGKRVSSVKDLPGNDKSSHSSSITEYQLSLAQIKEGLSKVQKLMIPITDSQTM